MKFRLLLRRLSVSAPSMRVTSRLSWPIRMAIYGFFTIILLTFGALIYDWSTGFSGATPISWRNELIHLRETNKDLSTKYEVLRIQNQLNENELSIERSTQLSFKTQLKNVEAENARLKEDLTHLQTLLPVDSNNKILIRRISGEFSNNKLSYQVLLFHNFNKNNNSFKGRIRLDVVGTRNGHTQTLSYPSADDATVASYNLDIQSYQRVMGELTLPEGTIPKHLVAKVYEGNKLVTQNSFQF